QWSPADAGKRTRAACSRRPRPQPQPPPAGPSRAPELSRAFGEIEREGFELDREVDVFEADVAGNLDARWREVQDGFDPRRGQLVGDRLRRLHGYRDDGDLN